MQFDSAKSMMRNLPPKNTAGLARRSVNCLSRLPRPPASTSAIDRCASLCWMRALDSICASFPRPCLSEREDGARAGTPASTSTRKQVSRPTRRTPLSARFRRAPATRPGGRSAGVRGGGARSSRVSRSVPVARATCSRRLGRLPSTICSSASIAPRSSSSGGSASSASTVQRSGVTSAMPLTTKMRRVMVCPS